MSRVINPDSAGKDRTRLSKSIVLTLRELAKLNEPTPEARDMAAFLALALEEIAASIDASVAAWEKRGYWVKADRFRMEWLWAGQMAAKMRAAVLSEDWAAIAMQLPAIAQKLSKVQVPAAHRLGRPWVGAWQKLRQ